MQALIDGLILGAKPLANKSTDTTIDLAPRKKPKPSDHTPLVAELRV